jgi:hypothetical protein
MKRLLPCFLLVLVTNFLFAQKREIQASLSVFPANFSNFLIEAKYKYRPVYAHFTLNTGLEYLHSNSYLGTNRNWNYSRDYSNDGFISRKLIVPFSLNFFIGNNYQFYGGIGLHGSVNFYDKASKYFETTRFQLGSYFNSGFQFKLKKKTFLNIEAKLIKDLSPSYKRGIPSHWGYVGMEGVRVNYFFLNIGASYRLNSKLIHKKHLPNN